jgi:hypothetical protein
MKIAYLPACLVASYESINIRELFEFGRRQMLITRLTKPASWWFALFSMLSRVLGFWGTLLVAVLALSAGFENSILFFIIPLALLFCQFIRALIRKNIAERVLYSLKTKIKPALISDLFLFWLWSILFLIIIIISGFGNTVTWRGIKYRLEKNGRTTILDQQT